MEAQNAAADCGPPGGEGDVEALYAHYSALTADTTIDSGTLLSTDYFNAFNEVVMLLGMVPDMPDILDEVYDWKFRTYREHFEGSGLPIAALAIECYAYAPEPIRRRFEEVVQELETAIEMAKEELRAVSETAEAEELGHIAVMHSMRLQELINTGSAVVHGVLHSLDQSAVDDLF